MRRKIKSWLIMHAVAKYQAELAKSSSEKKQGLRKVCMDVQKEYLKETGRVISLNHNTLANLAKGGVRLSEFNSSTKSWLTLAETDKVLEYVVEMARRGFPLSHKRLKEHVDEVCQARLGDSFPESGVGKNWTQHFVEKHSDHLRAYRAHSLDGARGRAVNPTTNKAWFEMLKDVLESGDDDKPMAPECIWGVDETGIQPGGGSSQERALGGAGMQVQYQQ